jgi:hypothetical protein
MTNHRPSELRPDSCCRLGPEHSCHESRALDCCAILGVPVANQRGYTCFVPEPQPPVQGPIEEPPIGEPISEPVTQTEVLENIEALQKPKCKC